MENEDIKNSVYNVMYIVCDSLKCRKDWLI